MLLQLDLKEEKTAEEDLFDWISVNKIIILKAHS